MNSELEELNTLIKTEADGLLNENGLTRGMELSIKVQFENTLIQASVTKLLATAFFRDKWMAASPPD